MRRGDKIIVRYEEASTTKSLITFGFILTISAFIKNDLDVYRQLNRFLLYLYVAYYLGIIISRIFHKINGT